MEGGCRWGLVPAYTKPNAKPDYFRMFNARSESVLEKPVFSRLLRSCRCIVLLNGFYEWKKVRPPLMGAGVLPGLHARARSTAF